tara:strand:- start:76 stop:621 length:546 start_codon:yes stop_codon:yes gene_type:complete
MKHKPLLPLEELKEFLDYNPDTGILTWKKKPCKNIKIGREAGSAPPNSPSSGGWRYRQFSFKGRRLYTHRVAYYMYHGVDPLEKQIDHINGNKLDNRIKNLRLATNQENQWNRSSLQRNNTSGKTGVTWYARHKKWVAQIEVSDNQKRKGYNLGYYTKKEDAIQARIEAEKKYFGDFRHGL